MPWLFVRTQKAEHRPSFHISLTAKTHLPIILLFLLQEVVRTMIQLIVLGGKITAAIIHT